MFPQLVLESCLYVYSNSGNEPLESMLYQSFSNVVMQVKGLTKTRGVPAFV